MFAQEEWCIFMANKHRFAKLKMTEFDEHFCDDMHEDMRVSELALLTLSLTCDKWKKHLFWIIQLAG